MTFWDPLQAAVGILFEEFVIPANVTLILQSENFLNKKEIESVVAEAKNKGPSEGARLLFKLLVEKKDWDWFSNVHSLLCNESVKLQHIADIMTKESNRFQPQSARYRRSNRNTRSNCEPATLSALYIKYNRDLDRQIRPLFLARIDDPVMALHVLQTYSGKVLTKIDCHNVKAEAFHKGDHDGAVLLFDRLVLYDGWLDVLLQALINDEIRLPDVADAIEFLRCKIKEDYEREWSQIQHFYNTNEDMQLADDCAAADDPGSVEMAIDTRGRPLREANVCDEYESDSAEMMHVVKRQARSASNKENTVSDGSRDGQDLALQGGSSEDGHGTTGKTKLMSAAASGKTDLLLSLIAGGADLDASDSKGRTSLMYAVVKRQVECIRLLISKGCNVNKRNIDGYTALMMSADKGFPDCMTCLIEGKSDLDNANDEGATALMFAAKNGFVDCMQLLIMNGCNINKRNNVGRTALMLAAFKGHSDCVDLLITSSCSINERDKKMATALMFAAQGGQQDCLTLLIKGRAVVDLVDEESNTAVMYAVLNNKVECLKILIDNQANINIASICKFTPLKVAEDWKYEQCVKVLKAAKGGR